MKVRNSLKSLRGRHRMNQLVRRKGRVYIINKVQKRFKARPGLILFRFVHSNLPDALPTPGVLVCGGRCRVVLVAGGRHASRESVLAWRTARMSDQETDELERRKFEDAVRRHRGPDVQCAWRSSAR